MFSISGLTVAEATAILGLQIHDWREVNDVFMYPQLKKSKRIRSGELVDHAMGQSNAQRMIPQTLDDSILFTTNSIFIRRIIELVIQLSFIEGFSPVYPRIESCMGSGNPTLPESETCP